MTLFPTHLSLAGIFLWFIIPDSEKIIFKKRKLVFWIILLFSVAPDLDIFLGIHRGLFHSLFPPLIITILGFYIYYRNVKSKDFFSSKFSVFAQRITIKGYEIEIALIGKSLYYIGTLWLLHILLDLDYPIAIFYPLSDQLYQFNFTFLLKMIPWFFLPVSLAGIGFNINSISYMRGLSIFFINLTPSEREAIYGTAPVPFIIEDFFIHFLIFVIFIKIVAIPMIPTIKNLSSMKFCNYYRSKISSISFNGTALSLALILIISGVVIGPLTGNSTTERNSVTGSFLISNNKFAPSIAISFETTQYLLQPNTRYFVDGHLVISSSNHSFEQVLLITQTSDYNIFSTAVSSLFEKYPLNTSDNLLKFKEGYDSLLGTLYSKVLGINLTNQNETYLNEVLPAGSYVLAGIIENWNNSEILEGKLQVEQAFLEIKIESSRLSLFLIGLFVFFTGIGLVFVSIRIIWKR